MTRRRLDCGAGYWRGCGVCAAALLGAALLPLRAEFNALAQLSVKNNYISTRGLLAIDGGLTGQLYANAEQSLPGLPGWFVNAGVFNDFSAGQSYPQRNGWYELDALGGLSHRWGASLFKAEYQAFINPRTFAHINHNIEFTLATAGYRRGAFSANPYAKVFWAISGPTLTVLGKNGATFDSEIGAVPSYSTRWLGRPAELAVPLWITVGPSEFWGGDHHFGVATAGLRGTLNLRPGQGARGGPYVSLGVQYFNLLNGRLVDAQAAQHLSPSGERNVVDVALSVGWR